MSDEEFLARWSRRKQQAKQGSGSDVPLPAQSAEMQVPPPSRSAEDETAPEPLSLPPIDSISATTDVAAFLRQGVPSELSRAALRRAWVSDPAIRDFVGLAENAWDFNNPRAMPGFGPLDCSPEQLGAIVDRIVGNVRRTADNISVQVTEGRNEQDDMSRPVDPKCELPLASAPEGKLDCAAAREISGDRPPPSSVAATPKSSRNENENDNDQVPTRGRTHGGALPR